MFNKKPKKVEKTQDKTIIDEIMKNIEEARKSKGFMVCVSWMYEEDGEDKLRHSVSRVRLGKEDVETSLDQYAEQFKTHDTGEENSVGDKKEGDTA